MKNAGCCGEVPTAELLGAIDQFNRGEWFECHETLEELWVGEKGELKDFYQGVLQLAVALHHWRNGNLKGALILLKSGSDCLSRVPDLCQGVEAAALAEAARALAGVLAALGEGRMGELDPGLILKVRLAG